MTVTAATQQTRGRVLGALLVRTMLAVGLYVGMPIFAMRMLPASVGGIFRLVPWFIQHAAAIVHGLNAGNPMLIDTAIRVILVSAILIIWCYLVLTAALSAIWWLLFHTAHVRSPREVRWLRNSAVLIFAIAQLIGALHNAPARRIDTAVSTTRTAVVQMANTSATIPGTRVAIPVGGDLWQVAAQSLGPTATPQQIEALVTQIAQLNNIADPNLVFPGQVVVVPEVPAPTLPSVDLAAPTAEVPAPTLPSVDLAAPTAEVLPSVSLAAPTALPDVTLAPATPAQAPVRSMVPAEEAALFALLGGGVAVSMAAMMRRKRKARPLYMRLDELAVRTADRSYLTSTEQAASVYRAAEQTLTLLSAAGAPMLRTLVVDEHGGAVATLAEPMRLPEPFEGLDEHHRQWRLDTGRGTARAVDETELSLTYGQMAYVGVTGSHDDRQHVLVPIDHVVRLRDVPADVWRALVIERAWLAWRSFSTIAVLGTDALDLPPSLATCVDAVVLDDQRMLLELVRSEMQSWWDRVGADVGVRPSNVRLHHQWAPLCVAATAGISQETYGEVRKEVGASRAVGILLADDGLPEDDVPVWTYDPSRDVLRIDDPLIGTIEVVPARISEAHALSQAAWLSATEEASYVPNDMSRLLALLKTRRPHEGEPMVSLCGPTPSVLDSTGAPLPLSPLAVRIAVVLALTPDGVVANDHLALAAGVPSLAEPAFWAALDELTNTLGSAIESDGSIVRIAPEIGLDLAKITVDNGQLTLAGLRDLVAQGSVLGVEAGSWIPWGRTMANAVRSSMIDFVVENALHTWAKSGNAKLLHGVRDLLSQWVSDDSAIALLEIAEIASTHGVDVAVRHAEDRFAADLDGDVPDELRQQVERIFAMANTLASSGSHSS